MKVKATLLGYYGVRRRRPGDVFNLSDKAHFAKSWMKPIGWVPDGYKAPKSAVKKQREAPPTNVDVAEVLEDDEEIVDEEVPVKKGKSSSDLEVI